ncbi:hypothetical protein B4168_0341 [Anoxybacillus flavithermus]|nr:hypothetical protein B4168_0341 [Anoxybacillus flavithermus]
MFKTIFTKRTQEAIIIVDIVIKLTSSNEQLRFTFPLLY